MVDKDSDKNSLADRQILSGIRSMHGINDAVAAIYRQFFPPLSWYTMNNSGTRQDAEDIFQEVVVTFIRLVQDGKFRGESTIKTFLYSLNRHAWLNELKKRTRTLAREEKFESEQDKNVVAVDFYIADREAKNKLSGLIAALGENCRKILTLYYFEGLSLREILLKLPYENEQVVRNKKYKCMKQLKEMIDANPTAMQILKNMLHG